MSYFLSFAVILSSLCNWKGAQSYKKLPEVIVPKVGHVPKMGQYGFDRAWFSVVFLFLLCFIAHLYEANGGTDMEVLACFRPVFFIGEIEPASCFLTGYGSNQGYDMFMTWAAAAEMVFTVWVFTRAVVLDWWVCIGQILFWWVVLYFFEQDGDFITSMSMEVLASCKKSTLR